MLNRTGPARARFQEGVLEDASNVSMDHPPLQWRGWFVAPLVVEGRLRTTMLAGKRLCGTNPDVDYIQCLLEIMP